MAPTTISQIPRTAPADPRYILSPEQQALLLSVLESSSVRARNSAIVTAQNDVTHGEPISENYDASLHKQNSDVEGLGDQSLTYPAEEQTTGPILGTPSDGDVENHEKRSHPDDEEDDEDGGGKRRERDAKEPKRSGRKILVNEPTSKRKAQNRAAQRAFRERKEKHLKDLETKVEDLQKASEAANHENALLRAKMERMEAELKAYKHTGVSSISPSVVPAVPSIGSFNNPNDINFHFDFAQFGKIGELPITDGGDGLKSIVAPAQASLKRNTSSGSNISPFEHLMYNNPQYGAFEESSFTNNMGIIHDFDNNMSTFGPISENSSGGPDLFSSSKIQSTGYSEAANNPVDDASASRTNSDSSRHQSTSTSTVYNSPSDSGNSTTNNGSLSSCGTSPEPHDSSSTKLGDNPLAVIGEESSNSGQYTLQSLYGAGLTPALELNGFDWSFHNNANASFDPQLFGDYREPQNAILAGQGLYDGSFFNEAINMEQLDSPLNLTGTPQPPKKDLVTMIDERLNDDGETLSGNEKTMTCDKMWERISQCPSVQNGDIDMNDLCSQLTQKAKCSGGGPVIHEKDFKDVIRGLFPKDKPCPTGK